MENFLDERAFYLISGSCRLRRWGRLSSMANNRKSLRSCYQIKASVIDSYYCAFWDHHEEFAWSSGTASYHVLNNAISTILEMNCTFKRGCAICNTNFIGISLVYLLLLQCRVQVVLFQLINLFRNFLK